MTKVISLDTSTSATGWALFTDGEYVRSGCIDLKNEKDSSVRLRKMVNLIIATLKAAKPDVVYIETPVVMRNAQALRNLTVIMGAVYGYCVTHGIYFEDLRPTEWRKYAKNGDEKLPRKRAELKEWSKNRVLELFNKEVSDDESDAILIGWSQIKRYENKEK